MNVSDLFAAVIAFEQAHWQGELAAAISQLPSIIVALTPYPKVDGFLKKLLQALNVVSLLTHKDSPGTLKPPFVQSQPPGIIGQPVSVAPVAKVVVFALLFLAGSARAQVFSQGPSLAFMEIRPGYDHPVQVAAGAGYQLSLGFFQNTSLIQGAEVDLLDVGFTVYGSAVSAPAGSIAGTLGFALFVGTLNEVLGVGIGEDMLSSNGTTFGEPPYGILMFNPTRFVFSEAPGLFASKTATRRWLTEYF